MVKLADRPEYDIRYSEAQDEKQLREWLKWPGMLSNFPFDNEKEMDPFIKNWVGFFQYKCSLTATYKGKVIGICTLFLMPYRKVAHHSMLNFIVDPHMQGRGIGSSLLKNIKHLAKNSFKVEGIHFDVYEGFKGMEMLKNQGFHEVFTQKDFVIENGKHFSRTLMEVKL